MLELTTSQKDDVLIVSLNGPLDSGTSADFKAWIEEKMLQGIRKFALNCLDLEYLSSRGIAVLSELSTLITGYNGRLVLFQLSGEVRNLIEFLKLDNKIPIASEVEAALYEVEKIKPRDLNQDFTNDHVIYETNTETNAKVPVDQKDIDQGESKTLPPEDDLEGDFENNREILAENGNTFCPNCGEKVKIDGKGLYPCPACRVRFEYPFK